MKFLPFLLLFLSFTSFGGSPLVKSVRLDNAQTCFINTDNKLICWGQSYFFKDLDALKNPKEITLFSAYKDVQLAVLYACVLSQEGVVKCDGNNPGSTPINNSVHVTEEFKFKSPVSEMALPDERFFCLLVAGQVLCRSKDKNFNVMNLPFPAKHIVTSHYKVCALLTSESVYCWDIDKSRVPAKVDFGEKVKLVMNGGRDLCALTESGRVVCKDYAIKGLEAGVESFSSSSGYNLSSETYCAILKTGEVKCWGSDRKPYKVPGIADAVKVEVGTKEACAVLKNNTVKCWKGASAPYDFKIPNNECLFEICNGIE